eukprot:scpid97057/ scgid25007/ 
MYSGYSFGLSFLAIVLVSVRPCSTRSVDGLATSTTPQIGTEELSVSTSEQPTAVTMLRSKLCLDSSEVSALQDRCNITCVEVRRNVTTSTLQRVPGANLPLVHKSLRMEFMNETVTGRLPMTMEVLQSCSSYYDSGEHPPCRCVVYNHRWVKVRYEMTCTDDKLRWMKTMEKVKLSCSCFREGHCQQTNKDDNIDHVF